ncbi:hypothetical protein SAMN05660657_03418 [Geodermatophilus amargosae]|jgi:hypothetical protein|uniref:DUF5313 domain-containing protein n=1 Tax=Geodermatophilus amargosae TaxID=1296565 RepID=A0A1I7BA62_9ACTN|nr:DUF5313 family protein [Geodermatophilus amargosae]SFT84086.1 hypothetical protein SAMN05660657_03418 [Geodermatophilus amargosae]
MQPDQEVPPRVRPGPLRWIAYAMGAGLPERHRTWVLYDTTTRTWVWRHVVRTFVQLAVPIALVLLLVPGAFWIRAMAALGGLILGMAFSLAYMTEAVENRVKKAGYAPGSAQAVRDLAGREREALDSERRRAAAAKRAVRYRDRRNR